MNDNNKLILFGSITIISLILTFIFIINDFINYAIVLFTITIILSVYIMYLSFQSKDEKTVYDKRIRKLLKTYDSIIIYSEEGLKLLNEKIIIVKSFEDLLVAHEELKKPIVYYIDNEVNLFTINCNGEMLVYILKFNDKNKSKYEDMIKNHIENMKKYNPTYIQRNNKIYKVIPVMNLK